MKIKAAQAGAILIAGLFFCLDRIAKHTAIRFPQSTSYIVEPWIGWEYFENTGIAFGIPVPLVATILITPLLIWLFIYTYRQQKVLSFFHFLSLALLIFGALSNFFDRLYHGFVIDYLRIYTSVINLADAMVVGAIILYLLDDLQTTKK